MERKNDFHLLENLTKKNSRRRLLKRGLALVSVVVLLVTANVLKRNAVAMVGETFCGYDYDHVHSEECFDADGALICDLHVHTDECYEEPTPEEVEVDLSDLEGATEAVEEAEAVVPEAVPSDGTFDLAGSHQVMLSEVLAQTMLPVSRDQIEMVGLVDDSLQGDEAQGEAPVAVAMLEQDVAITALRDFSTAEIAIVTADDIYTIQLMNGAANAEIEAAAEETTEETEETVEETAENIEEIIETTEEEPQEVAAEPAQESEITEAVEEHTEENSEANIEETVEEITAEITDGDEAETEPAEIDETVTGEVVEETVETEEADEETAETEETAEVEETEEAAAEMQAIEASEEAAEAVAEIEETEENTEETAEIEETEENTEAVAEIEETEETTEETEEESEEETTEEETAEEETEEESEEKSEEEETEEEATEEETAEEESEEESTEEEAAEEKTEEEETTEEESEEESEEEETTEEETSEEETEGESEEAAEEEAAEALDIETLFPAQTFEDHAGNIRVTVTAGVGAFPAGTEMRLTPVWDQETLDGIADSVSEDFVEVKQVLAVDIAFFNAEGEEIEPLLPVSVVMAVEEIEQHQDAVVVHMDDEGNTEVVEQTETAFTEDTERALNVELPAAEDAETQMAQLVEKLEAEAAEQTEAETEPAEAEAADEPAAEAEGVEAVTEEVAIETEEAEPAEETTEVTFEADGFSLYAVVVTETIETRYIAADGATFNISVRYGEDAKIPANATLAVEELTGEATEDYLAQTEELLAEGETITLARYFDITILDAEGNALQPQAPVSVEVKLADDPADAVQAVHFAEEGAELIDASRNDEEAVTFSAEGFSVYGIVYTVDFYYDVDGKTYEYHIKGGDVLSLKALLPILKVVEEDAAEEFVANIEDVRFSDESLVKVFRVDEDTTAGAILDALGVKLEAHARDDEAVEAPEEISEEDIDALEAAAEAAGETADEVVEAANPSAALTEEDIENIKAKTFTAPDWALVSLQPFTSHESLTITLRNGEVVTIRVDDDGEGTITVNDSDMGYMLLGGAKDEIEENHKSFIYGRQLFKTTSDQTNNYRIDAVANPGYVFSYWELSRPGVTPWPAGSADYQTSRLSGGTITRAQIFGDSNNGPLSFKAVFEPIICRMIVDESSRGKGKIRVPWYFTTDTEAEYLPRWRDNWNDGNNRNKDIIEAIPNAGYVFVRWEYYLETKHNTWVRDPSKDLTTQKFNVGEFNLDPNGGKGWRYNAVFAQPHVKVSVNNANAGDVVSLGNNNSMVGQYVTDDQGRWLPGVQIKAVSRDNDYVFSHWTLSGNVLDIMSDTITAENWLPDEAVRGDDLQAVFAKVIDANGNAHSTIQLDGNEKAQFEKWLTSLQSNQKLSADKSAKVYDYDNRIYQVDISAESARVNPSANIGVAFIVDASNSMQFPANLQRTGKTMVLTQETMDAAFPGEKGPYYIISEPTKTATVYRVYKEDDDDTWYAIDASYYYDRHGYYKNKVWTLNGTNRYSDVDETQGTLLAYPIYKDADNGNKRRVDYLNDSMGGTIDAMRDIVTKVNDSNYNISVAYTMFASFTEHHYPSNVPQDALAKFHTVDFQKLGTNDNIYINFGDTYGGTRHDLGLQEAIEEIHWDNKGIPNDQRYAILISDGAAVIEGGSTATTWDKFDYNGVQTNIVNKANELKNKGVKLITVGLSTKNVSGGSTVLRDIASDGLFFEAESGEDLENILYKILQTVVKNATICGTVVDEVDEAFYPVMPDGTPIPTGTSYYAYNADGSIKTLTEAEYTSRSPWEPKFKWEENGGKWKITWEHQYIGWDPTDADPRKRPWHQSILVKAKENFLGGNTINTNNTNSGTCRVVEDGYTFKDSLTDNINDWTMPPPDRATINLPVPYVNVDELSLTQNSSEWTVYLGTKVNPLEELKSLYGKIDVNEVVTRTTGGQHVTMTAAGDTLYEVVQSNADGKPTKLGAVPETFPLSEVAPLYNDDWTTLIDDGEVVVHYGAYGHNNVGTITYRLTKTVATDEDGLTNTAHETEVVGSEVEKYILTVSYAPTDETTPTNGWHTTPGGVRGHETGSMQSTNGHKINVFAKKLAVKKMDATLNTELKGAKFALVKTNGSTPTVGDASTYTVIDNLTVDSSGTVFTSGDIARPKAGEQYFLIETQAPTGYVGLGVPVPVSLAIYDKYRAVPRVSDVYSKDPLTMPYDWIEEATLSLDTTNIGQIKRTTEKWVEDNTALTPDYANTTLYYVVPNNPGVKLPSTGGAGTGAYTAIGGALALLAIALMLRKQREN